MSWKGFSWVTARVLLPTASSRQKKRFAEVWRSSGPRQSAITFLNVVLSVSGTALWQSGGIGGSTRSTISGRGGGQE